jgi:hypothetical protein
MGFGVVAVPNRRIAVRRAASLIPQPDERRQALRKHLDRDRIATNAPVLGRRYNRRSVAVDRRSVTAALTRLCATDDPLTADTVRKLAAALLKAAEGIECENQPSAARPT